MASEGGGNGTGITRTLSWLWKGNGEPEEESLTDWFKLSRKQRITGFFVSLLLGVFCFFLAFLLAPFIVLKAKKFVILFTLGSLFSLGSFSFLWGPWNHLKHLLTLERLPFTASYILSIVGTLWAALWLKSTILAIVFAVIQILALLWFIFSYIPGGTTGLSFMTKLFSRLVTSTLKSTILAIVFAVIQILALLWLVNVAVAATHNCIHGESAVFVF